MDAPAFRSPIAPALRLFWYNRSQHPDTVRQCWYDSGDYVVFAPRNAAAVWYLSMAYAESVRPDVRADLRAVIDQQLVCLDGMMQKGIKQFRDQQSHGVNVPPILNRLLYPQRTYAFAAGEGRDVAALLALAYRNIGENERAKAYAAMTEGLVTSTVADGCCEEGPLRLPSDWQAALPALLATSTAVSLPSTWGIQPPAVLRLAVGDTASIAGVLGGVARESTERGDPFAYLGGNYDIAGTIALERLYAKKTGDEQFWTLSQKLRRYLSGENAYRVDFSDVPEPYHPCRFFRACSLGKTLINGIDERHSWDLTQNAWRVAEPQLLGQAQFVLAEVLYHGW